MRGGRCRFSVFFRQPARKEGTIIKDTEQLIARIRDGDRGAQEELVLAVQDRVYLYCRKLLRNEEDAQDAAQDVLIAMLTGLDALRSPGAFRTWLDQTTAHTCYKKIAQNRVRRRMLDRAAQLLDSREDLCDQTIPDKILDTEENRRIIHELVDALPEPQRMCVLLYYYGEMPVKDIAAAMEVSENTIKSRLHYARRTIKRGCERIIAQGTPLYGLSPLPFLQYFLQKEASGGGLSAAAVQALVKALHSDAVKDYINNTFGGAVVPAF